MSVATQVLENYLDELGDRDPAGWFQQRIYHAERTAISRALDRVRYAESVAPNAANKRLSLVPDERFSPEIGATLDKPD